MLFHDMIFFLWITDSRLSSRAIVWIPSPTSEGLPSWPPPPLLDMNDDTLRKQPLPPAVGEGNPPDLPSKPAGTSIRTLQRMGNVTGNDGIREPLDARNSMMK